MFPSGNGTFSPGTRDRTGDHCRTVYYELHKVQSSGVSLRLLRPDFCGQSGDDVGHSAARQKKVHDSSFTSSSSCHLSYLPCSPAALNPSPIISDISLIRLSGADSPFSPPHPYVSAHVEQYLRSVHGGSALSMMSAARGLTPAQCKFGQLLVM